MAFKKGETVSILTESGTFMVLEVGAHRSILQDENGFERQVPNSLIVPRQNVAGHVHQKDAEVITPRSPSKTPNRIQEFPCIDLHAESLGISHIPPKDILPRQLACCRAFLNTCLRDRKPKIMIIHGVGDGTLRTAVRKMLSGKEGVSFHDAVYSVRGIGATWVELQIQRTKPF
jgi:hypothetical protein